MGWINQGRVRKRGLQGKDLKAFANEAANAQNLEHAFCPQSVRDEDLPFIQAGTVAKNDASGNSRRLCKHVV